MAGESLAIVLVILVMAVMFLRARKRIFALMVVPLIAVPAGYLIAAGIYSIAQPPLSFAHFAVVITLAGMAAGVILCLLFSRLIPTRRGKTAYLIFTVLFSILLSVSYLIRLL